MGKAQHIYEEDPEFYIDVLLKLQELTEDASLKQSLNSSNNKSFNILR